jgi:glycosyltransferase involved in cell wall biosynthesis
MISLIIPTLNRTKLILDLVKRLNAVIQVTDEVIFVDDSLESQKEALTKQANFNFQYLHRGIPLGVSSARNDGVKSANGDYLIFLDDDDDFGLYWLKDFKSKLSGNPDLIYCDMKVMDSHGKESSVRNLGQKRITVIPGAWMVKKTFFQQAGGFDERLKFGENTELFFRMDQQNPKESFIPKLNFFYNPSIDGGSKNLQNMVDSNLLVLEKHGDQLSNHVKHLYHQVIGVNFLRFRKFNDAQSHLWEAYKLKPTKATTLLRFFISMFPWVSKMVYSKEVKIK